MPNDASREFAELARRLRRALRMGELTPEQAQAEYDAAEPADVPEATIEAMVNRVFEEQDEAEEPTFEITEWTPEADTNDVESDVFQLNRNEGEADPEVDELIEKHRREALDDEDGGDDSKDHSENETSD